MTNPYDADAEREAIQEALAEVDAGQTIPVEVVRALFEVRFWLDEAENPTWARAVVDRALGSSASEA
ncbi:hypothetical protein [Burkholderia vietnamiensis]|uniref:hypothetical protein n=1 Tax=Burkholderia vietnamiensis TaxID=60552 RepID=UPI001CF0FC16|nr:hypothetical protein [Burkholderia vietnamiensis]MCA8292055.1 hypothetical protein [Burkholderia vietnamiensis]HDR9165938.1 hypothetical protein [Burkholderia vietnamiensis]HDR9172653.1 hypothetical protein [Burkholderia vietnamiensis]